MPESADRQSPLEQDVRFLKGVGAKRAELLGKLGLETVHDVLMHLPRTYEDRRNPTPIAELKPDTSALVRGEITFVNWRRGRRRGIGILQVAVRDETGVITLTWFNARANWQESFPEGSAMTAFGPVTMYDGLQMVAPDYHVGDPDTADERFGCMVPVYSLTEGTTQRLLRQVVRAALDAGADSLAEIFPRAFLHARGMPGIERAIWDVHFPPTPEALDAARHRMAYEELFLFQTALALRKQHVHEQPGVQFRVGPNVDRRIRRLFPFKFTAAQDRAIAEVCEDMRTPHPMNRLLQGDVGCGKTVVAVYAMLAALAESSKGYQVAIMAPTSILAEQHYLTMRSILERARVRTALLTGTLDAATRRRHLRGLATGEIDLVVGTHALIQESVEFRNLALTVVDEQHRFGVRQRLALRRKGLPPDVLIMTATPIPRTLALAYLSDLDVSVIDEMPPGRKPVHTELFTPGRWELAFDEARRELARGRRVFVVYPLVEENEDLDVTSAQEGYRELAERVFPGYSCCLLHGQMSQAEKQSAMEGFRDGRFQVMAATTVIEVGINVPEATVMIVQHAERLGLAQLHQLRGRIGRGRWQGRCYLLADPHTEEATQRLEALVRTNDGFAIAEEDLRLRGPGQFFGTQQSGMPEFRCYDFSDTKLLHVAQRDAHRLVAADPDLTDPRHVLLRKRVLAEYGKRFVLADVG